MFKSESTLSTCATESNEPTVLIIVCVFNEHFFLKWQHSSGKTVRKNARTSNHADHEQAPSCFWKGQVQR